MRVWEWVRKEKDWVLTNAALALPGCSPRLVSPSSSYSNFSLALPCCLSLPTDPEPPGTAKDPPNWIPVAVSPSLVVGFIGLLVLYCRRILYCTASFSSDCRLPAIRGPALDDKVVSCIRMLSRQGTWDLGPGTIRRRPQPVCWE